MCKWSSVPGSGSESKEPPRELDGTTTARQSCSEAISGYRYGYGDMRGNWDHVEPITMPPEQSLVNTEMQQMPPPAPQQQQQQHHLQEQTTTPWMPVDRAMVKQEVVDDKNNDSGISPGHYTSSSASPSSQPSPTGDVGSVPSPDPASLDSEQKQQMNGYAYAPTTMTKTDSVQAPEQEMIDEHRSGPLDYACTAPVQNDSLENVQIEESASMQGQDLSARSATLAKLVASASFRLSLDQLKNIEISPDLLKCPCCSFSSLSRIFFSEHLVEHCSVAAKLTDGNEFARIVLEQLVSGTVQSGSPEEQRASPNPDEPQKPESEQVAADADEPGLKVPRVNAQGKVKTFKCKQCDFIAITKLDFWDHSRVHIKADKILSCPKCPFVTEYKHHLEYHLRNHFGSKPYKCDKCNYSCVNKSMLNSHLKSHSNVYQFRCANCTYATKYCHSLKLHLRKYKHSPAMVLNADGSPNPLPIIDVYGTRRGPKAKPKKEPKEPQQQQQQQQLQQQPQQMQQQPQQQQQQPQMMHASPSAMPTVVPQRASPVEPTAIPTHFQFNPLNGFAGFTGAHAAITSAAMAAAAPGLLGFQMANPFFPSFPITNPNGSLPLANFNQMMNANDAEMTANPQIGNPVNLAHQEPEVIIKEEVVEENSNPLDLSKPDNTVTPPPKLSPVANVKGIKNINNNNSPKATGTSRRKGRAVKLDRRVIAHDSDEEMPQEERTVGDGNGTFAVRTPTVSPSGSNDSRDSGTHPNSASFEYGCSFCDITFGNEIMHTVHMGYHGFHDPYVCNMCGTPCEDKISFFLHIARYKHP